MNILLKDTDLLNLLRNHKRDIGRSLGDAAAIVFAGITVAIPTYFASYNPVAKWSLIAIGILFALYGACSLYEAIHNQYDYIQLYKDIENMNRIKHPFSIVAIKDSFNQYPNRFLLRYDDQWKCNLFFSFRTLPEESDNEENIRNRLSSTLKVDKNKIKVQFKTSSIYKKYSVSDRVSKWYDHSIYQATIESFSDILKHDTFQIEGTDYCWMTIDAMKSDPEIRKKNMDVVKLVETNIL